jgi:hypothetical protein
MLVEAVAESRTMKEVFARLGIAPGRYEYLREHIARLGLDASHVPVAGSASPNARLSWTDAQLAEIVRTSSTVAEVGRRLVYKPSGGIHRMLIGHSGGSAWTRHISPGSPGLEAAPCGRARSGRWRRSWSRTRG